jgi:LPXTG-motif cell wall-anchored protein
LTGASGTIVMTVSGIALVLTGAGAYVVARKRSRH